MQNLESGLNDLLSEAVERNIAHVEQKTGALDRYLNVSSHYVKQLRCVTEVAKVSVDRWEAHVKELMDRSAPPAALPAPRVREDYARIAAELTGR